MTIAADDLDAEDSPHALREHIDHITANTATLRSDHDMVRDDLARAGRLITTMLATFTEHNDGPLIVPMSGYPTHPVSPQTRSVWLDNETVAEWRAIAATVTR